MDVVIYTRRCYACQVYAKFMHQPLEYLHACVVSMPFKAWGMNIVRLITPLLSKGNRFILAIIHYVSKWAETIPMREVKTIKVVKFIKHLVIYHFGVLELYTIMNPVC